MLLRKMSVLDCKLTLLVCPLMLFLGAKTKYDQERKGCWIDGPEWMELERKWQTARCQI